MLLLRMNKMVSDKKNIRKTFLDAQKLLTFKEVNDKSLMISDLFFKTFDLRSVKFLHIFLPIQKFNEVNTYLIIDKLIKDFPQINIIIPKTDLASLGMTHFIYGNDLDLLETKWGIKEPLNGKTIEPTKIDLVIIPLLAFDESGNRVGYGKGFYDRFLAECKEDVIKIGCTYYQPIKKISDANEFDIKLNHCITPEKIYNF